MSERSAHPAGLRKRYLAIIALASLAATAGGVGATVTTQSTVAGNHIRIEAPGVPAADSELPTMAPDVPSAEQDESPTDTEADTEADTNAPTTWPEAPAAEPEAPAIVPEAPVADPEGSATEPDAPATQPEAPTPVVVSVMGAPLTIQIEPGAEPGRGDSATTEFVLTNSGGSDATVLITKATELVLESIDLSVAPPTAQLIARLATGDTVFTQELAGPGASDEPTALPIIVPANGSVAIDVTFQIGDTSAFRPTRLTFHPLVEHVPTGS